MKLLKKFSVVYSFSYRYSLGHIQPRFKRSFLRLYKLLLSTVDYAIETAIANESIVDTAGFNLIFLAAPALLIGIKDGIYTNKEIET